MKAKFKEFFYLSELYNFARDRNLKALTFEEIAFGRYDIKFVSFGQIGELYENKEIYVGGVCINKIYQGEDEYNLCVSHELEYKQEKIITIKFLNGNPRNFANYINELFLFIKANERSVKQYGFRDFLTTDISFDSFSVHRYYEKVIKLKTHRLNTSRTNVGKDNDFYEYMIITYANDKDYYFIKLLSDFFKSSYNSETKTITCGQSRESAWSPSFEPYTTPDNFEYKRAELIEYISKNFDFNEYLNYTLLNIPFKEW